MVNNFKPYDPNDESERSSGESFITPKKPTPKKVDNTSQSFPDFPEDLERDNFSTPVVPNPTKNKIIEESNELEKEVSSIIKEVPTPYITTIGKEPTYEFTDPVFQEFKSQEEEFRADLNKESKKLESAFEDFDSWNDSFSGSEQQYDQAYAIKEAEFDSIKEKYNQKVGYYNSFVDANIPYIQEKEQSYIKRLEIADQRLQKLNTQWDSASKDVPFDITGVDYGSDLSKRPDWQVPKPSPDFSQSGRDNTSQIQNVIGDYQAINFGSLGVDHGSKLEKVESAKIKPLVFTDLKQDEKFVEAQGDRKTGTFERIAPSYKTPTDKISELENPESFYKADEKYTPNLNPLDPNRDPLSPETPQLVGDILNDAKKSVKETISNASNEYQKDVKAWLRNFSDNFVRMRVGSTDFDSPETSLGDVTLVNPIKEGVKKTASFIFADLINNATNSIVYEKNNISSSMSSIKEELLNNNLSSKDLVSVFRVPHDLANRVKSYPILSAKGLIKGLDPSEKNIGFSSLFFEDESVINGANKDWKETYNKVFKNQKALGMEKPTPFATLNSLAYDLSKTWKHNSDFDNKFVSLGGDGYFNEAYHNLTPEEKKIVSKKPYAIEELGFQTLRGLYKRAVPVMDTVFQYQLVKMGLKGSVSVLGNITKKQASILEDVVSSPVMTKSKNGLEVIKNKFAPVKTGQYKMFDGKNKEVIGVRVIDPRFTYEQAKSFSDDLIGVKDGTKIYDGTSFLKDFSIVEIERQVNPSIKKMWNKIKNPTQKKPSPVLKYDGDEVGRLIRELEKDSFFKTDKAVASYITNPSIARKKMTNALENILKDNEKLDKLVGGQMRKSIKIQNTIIDNLHASGKFNPSLIKKDIQSFMDSKVLRIISDPSITSKFSKAEFNKLAKSYIANTRGVGTDFKKYEYLFPLFKDMGKTVTSNSKQIAKDISKKFSEITAPKNPVSSEDIAKAWDKEFPTQQKTAELISRVDEAIGGFKSPEKINRSALSKKLSPEDMALFEKKWKLSTNAKGEKFILLKDNNWDDFLRGMTRRSKVDETNRINYLGNTAEKSSIEALYGDIILEKLGIKKSGLVFSEHELNLIKKMLAYTQKALPVAKSDKGLILGSKKAKGINVDLPFPTTVGGLGTARIKVTSPSFDDIKKFLASKDLSFSKPKPTTLKNNKSSIKKSLEKTSTELPSPDDILKRYKLNIKPQRINPKIKTLATIDLKDLETSNSLPVYEDLKAYKTSQAKTQEIKTKLRLFQEPFKSTIKAPSQKTTMTPKITEIPKVKTKTLISTKLPSPDDISKRYNIGKSVSPKTSKSLGFPRLKERAKTTRGAFLKEKVLTRTIEKTKLKERAKTKEFSKIKLKDITKTIPKIKTGTPKGTPVPIKPREIKKSPSKKIFVKLPKISEDKIQSKIKKAPKNITRVGWRQGSTYPVVNLEKDTVKFFKKKPQGIKVGRTPRDSFSILERKNISRKKKKRLSMGRFDVSINGDVSFQLKRRNILPLNKLTKRNKLRKI